MNEETRNTVMQLNMGEGKTSVIMPMVIALLANGLQLARIIVLHSLFNMNYTAFVHSMGGLLNKRVYTFPFHRELSVTSAQMATFHSALVECMRGKHIVLTVPEHCLSLKLKSIEMCGNSNNSSNDLCQQLVSLQHFLEQNVRDILDESDELLSVKYQLVYSVGGQTTVDGESLRWKCAQDVLKLASRHCAELKSDPRFADSIEYNNNSNNNNANVFFAQVRLLDEAPFGELCARICRSFLTKSLPNMQTPLVELRSEQLAAFTAFVLDDGETSDECVNKQSPPPHLRCILHILRGLLAYRVLYVVLSKRWKVEYGVNDSVLVAGTSERRLLQAVPYRAKDVPAPRAQFAHADICIGLTTLSYYYSGLSDQQLEQLFDALDKEANAHAIYSQWMEAASAQQSSDHRHHHQSIQCSYSELLNFLAAPAAERTRRSRKQNEQVLATVRRLPCCVDYWLDKCLFAREAKEFEHKLSASAWDLCTLSGGDKPTTGFSGTNDSRLLLPTSMHYHEVNTLVGTSAQVIDNLLNATNTSCCYESLSAAMTDDERKEADVSREILKRMLARKDANSRVLLDVGALILTMSNKQLVTEWLRLLPSSGEVDAAVYFDENELCVLERASGRSAPFETSIYKQQLHKCVIYLDEIHTRGTDLKIPLGVCATVTLGRGLTKDRLVQACMRMRQLGHGQRVHFVASAEVNTAICRRRNDKRAGDSSVTCIDVIEWTISNSLSQIDEHFMYWADQGVAHCRKRCAMEEFKVSGDKRKYFHACREKFANKLEHLYGRARVESPLCDIVRQQILALRSFLVENGIGLRLYENESLKLFNRMEQLVSDKRRFMQLLQEEAELEIEMQQETHQQQEIQRPRRATAHANNLDEDVWSLVVDGHFEPNSDSFVSLGDSLANTSLASKHRECNAAWPLLIKATRDFVQTVQTSNKNNNNTSDDYLATPRWVVNVPTSSPTLIQLLVISDFEANALWSHLYASSSSVAAKRGDRDCGNRLYLFSPRMRHGQERLFDMRDMTPVKSRIRPIQLLLEQLALYAGSFYFNEKSELQDYLNIVGYCPSPRTPHLNACFDRHLIAVSGFVAPAHRMVVFGNPVRAIFCQYQVDPSQFIVRLLEIRHFGIVPNTSHQLDVLLRGRRPQIFI